MTTVSAAAFTCAFLATLAFTPVVTASLRRSGQLDVPNERSSHSAAVPRGGGLACAGGVVLGLLVVRPELSALGYTALASVALLTVVGHLDDHLSLASSTRLVVQLSAGALMGAPLGVGWAIFTSATFVVIVNCINFMDGINGITSVSMVLWGLTMTYISVFEAIPLLGTLGVVTAGTALGFLPWNVPRAYVFLGDVGSYLYGGVVAAGTAVAVHAGAPFMMVLAPLVLYVFDVGLTLLRRCGRRARILHAHREHIYQRLPVELGLDHARVTVFISSLNAIIVALWLWAPVPLAVATTAVVLAMYTYSIPLGRRMLIGAPERQAS